LLDECFDDFEVFDDDESVVVVGAVEDEAGLFVVDCAPDADALPLTLPPIPLLLLLFEPPLALLLITWDTEEELVAEFCPTTTEFIELVLLLLLL